MPEHIGIVAVSAEGAALCYRALCLEGASLLGPHNHPEVTMHTFPLAEYMRHIERDDWQGVAELMLASAEKLANAGADFLICPDNTAHQALPFLRERSPLPWLHIAEEAASEAVRLGYHKLAVTGTKYLVESDVYPEKLRARGLEFLRPDKEERERINQIIFDELVYGEFKPASLRYFQAVITRMKNQGCDAVVLGCTELPLLVSPVDSPLPTLDSTRLLARAALRRAVGTSIGAVAARG
ncbi:MAG TPA: amino acid racemase [Terriglobales bacterium]|nr:amino acid racemase [Terriglobales bacterium]